MSPEELIDALHAAAHRRDYEAVGRLLAELEPYVTQAELIAIWNALPRPEPAWRGPWVVVKAA